MTLSTVVVLMHADGAMRMRIPVWGFPGCCSIFCQPSSRSFATHEGLADKNPWLRGMQNSPAPLKGSWLEGGVEDLILSPQRAAVAGPVIFSKIPLSKVSHLNFKIACFCKVAELPRFGAGTSPMLCSLSSARIIVI